MMQWLALAAAFYALAVFVFPKEPQLQTLCWKLGNVTIAAFVGYKLDKHAFRFQDRMGHAPTAHDQIRRAIVMAAAMVAVSMGL